VNRIRFLISRARSRIAAACEWMFGASPNYCGALMCIAQSEAMAAAAHVHLSALRSTIGFDRSKIRRALEELAKDSPDLKSVASILRGDDTKSGIVISISADASGFQKGIDRIIESINGELTKGPV
jgi:uncharacterized protein YigA (DUF484 family)